VDDLLKQLPALLGVVVGATGSYLFSDIAERSRWRRQQMVRWDDKRYEAYVSYSHAVKRMVSLAARIAATKG
jgi:hypothetical protein